MQKINLKDLLERYELGTCSEEEQILVESWYLNWDGGAYDLSDEELLFELNKIKNNLPGKKNYIKPAFRIAAAALITITAGVSFYFLNHKEKAVTLITPIVQKIEPGRNQATLTLSNGSTVVLDTGMKHSVISQQGVKITKTAEGKLVYTKTDTGAEISGFNTIKTPKGGMYNVTLPDGTKVTLNAATNLTFPVVFGDHERSVELNGEAYFEVAKNANKPFKVHSGNQTVQVLGTQFNVHSYKDEPVIKTTLLEGSVLVKGSNEVILKPGQQSQTSHTADKFKILNVDVQNEVAWKDNLFFFENEPIKKIMLEISRWYDVEVVFQDNIQNKKVWGSITRFSEMSTVLGILETTGNIHFKVEGRRVLVMK